MTAFRWTITSLLIGALACSSAGGRDTDEAEENEERDPVEDAGSADAGDEDGGTEDAGTADAGTEDAGSEADGGASPDAGTPDASTCDNRLDEALTLRRVSGPMVGPICGGSSSSTIAFYRAGTNELVAEAEDDWTWDVVVPEGTYDVVVHGCLVREGNGGGGYRLADELVVDRDLDLDVERTFRAQAVTGLATKNGSPIVVPSWEEDRLELVPVSGPALPPQGLARANDGRVRDDHYAAEVRANGAFEQLLPPGRYWAHYDTLATGPIDVTGGTLNVDFDAVSTVVTLEVNGLSVEGVVYVRPVGAPGDVIWVDVFDGQQQADYVPGTYDVWLVQLDPRQDFSTDEWIVPPLLGVAEKRGGLVVDRSGRATITFTFPRVTGTVTCGGIPFSGNVGFASDGPPGEVWTWWGQSYGLHHIWDGALEVLLVPSTGSFTLWDGPSTCHGPLWFERSLAATGPLQLDFPLVTVTPTVRVDGRAANADNLWLYRLENGRWSDVSDPIPPGPHLAVYQDSLRRLETQVTVPAAGGALAVSFQTRPVTFSMRLSGTSPLPPAEVRFAPQSAAGRVEP